MTREEIIEAFDISKISPSPAIFDLEKLQWMNGVYIRSLSSSAFYERARPYLPRDLTPTTPPQPLPWSKSGLKSFAKCLK